MMTKAALVLGTLAAGANAWTQLEDINNPGDNSANGMLSVSHLTHCFEVVEMVEANINKSSFTGQWMKFIDAALVHEDGEMDMNSPYHSLFAKAIHTAHCQDLLAEVVAAAKHMDRKEITKEQCAWRMEDVAQMHDFTAIYTNHEGEEEATLPAGFGVLDDMSDYLIVYTVSEDGQMVGIDIDDEAPWELQVQFYHYMASEEFVHYGAKFVSCCQAYGGESCEWTKALFGEDR